MFAPPPKMNKISLYSKDSKNLKNFYSEFGMLFNKRDYITNDKQVICYQYVNDNFIFEIIQSNKSTNNVSLCFLIDEIDGYLENIDILKNKWVTETHSHIIVKDPDGNSIELMTEM